ncbi:hypothetical protein Q4E40_02505 [Pontibacter sp. BT731]|uniref:hypothetical protein n=1 Tax=Pontibacter coccineus TaxID=3063328 RepID=UPI0026E2F1AE|nr:hypothetical protein [Pontibacter sp. BT731]MDO6388983.1 hypothetical protein [Pontibacter sp. BT731]
MPTIEKLIEELPWRIKGDYRLLIRKYDGPNAKYSVAYVDLDLNLKQDFFAPTLLECLHEMKIYLAMRPELTNY